MTKRPRSSSDDQQIDMLLRQYDEALSSGDSIAALDEHVSRLPQAEADRFEQLCHCVGLLEEARRVRESQCSESALPEDLSAILRPAKLPERIGRFELRGEIGRGGCGVVLLAHDPKLNRDVAIKIPRPEALVSTDLRERFFREARAAGSVDHPNIVSIYEVGEDGPVSFIAAAYIPGPSLATWLSARPDQIDVREAATLIAVLAAALEHAHTRGVVHRDIKPGNILLQPLGSSNESASLADYIPKITDFGLAKLRETTEAVTHTGAVIGTPLYMAPEQAEGRLDEIGPATDIYALGAIFFELLTGQPPLRGESDVDTLRRIVSDDPPLVRIARPRIPRDLEAICLKCLEKRPAHRYLKSSDLAEDLHRFLSGTPTEARPIGTTRRVWRWARRRPAITALMLVSLLLLVLLVSGTGIYNARLANALNTAKSERNRAEAERNRAEAETLASRKLLYSAEVRLAYDAWQTLNRARTLELLTRQIPDDGQLDLREFAWHWLWGQCHAEIRSFVGHTDEIFSVDFSPDGKTLATASKDGTARIWDVSTGKMQHLLEDHTTEVTCVRFSPDGKRLATGSEDCQILVWDPQSGELLFTLSGHENHVLTIAFSQDGRQLASGGRDDCVRLWNLDTKETIRVLTEPSRHVRCIRYAPDGRLLVACDEGGAIHCWNTDDWTALPPFEKVEGSLFAVEFHEDSRRLVAAGRDSIIYAWDLTGEAPLGQYGGKNHESWIRDIGIAPNGTMLATANQNGILRLWDIEKRGIDAGDALLAAIPAHSGRIWSLAWSPEAKLLATAGADGTVKLWDSARLFDVPAYPSLDGWVGDFSFSANSSTLVTNHNGGKLCRWDVASHTLISSHGTNPGEWGSLAISPEARYAATAAGTEASVLYQDLDSGEVLFEDSGYSGGVHDLAMSPDATLLAVASENKTLTLVELSSGKRRQVLHHQDAVEYSTFAPDGLTLVTGSRELRLWDVQSGDLLWRRREHEANPRSAVFSPDGELMAVSVGDHSIDLVNASSGETLESLEDNHGRAGCLAFSPDGNVLAVGYPQPSVITLWDMRTSQELCVLDPQLTFLFALAFSPDGKRLVVSGHKGGKQRHPNGTGEIVEWVVR